IERTLIQMPASPDLRALEVVYRYRLEDVGESSRLPRVGLTVSLRAEGEVIGSTAAISRSNDSPFSPDVQGDLDGLAGRPGLAISSALRSGEARERAGLAPLGALNTRRLFDDFPPRETARARRY